MQHNPKPKKDDAHGRRGQSLLRVRHQHPIVATLSSNQCETMTMYRYSYLRFKWMWCMYVEWFYGTV